MGRPVGRVQKPDGTYERDQHCQRGQKDDLFSLTHGCNLTPKAGVTIHMAVCALLASDPIHQARFHPLAPGVFVYQAHRDIAPLTLWQIRFLDQFAECRAENVGLEGGDSNRRRLPDLARCRHVGVREGVSVAPVTLGWSSGFYPCLGDMRRSLQ